MSSASDPAEFYAPRSGKGLIEFGPNRLGNLVMGFSGIWGDDAARHLVEGGPRPDELRWQMAARFSRPSDGDATASALSFHGGVLFSRMTARIMGRLPLQLGASFTDGADKSSIRRIVLHTNTGLGVRELHVVLEEHDAGDIMDRFPVPAIAGPAVEHVDCFLLRDVRSHRVTNVWRNEIHAVGFNGERVSATELITATPVEMPSRFLAWCETVELIKIRFTQDGTFTQPLSQDAVTVPSAAWTITEGAR